MFDRYTAASIKAGTRLKREGRTRSVLCKIDSRDIFLPVNWKSYIDLPEQKANLTRFLRVQMMLVGRSKEGVEQYELITGGGFDDKTAVESSRGSDMHMLQSCQEEADTHIILHAKAAHREGYERLIISCRDSDVLVLFIYFSGQLARFG